MSKKQMVLLIEKFINHTLSAGEAEELLRWLENDSAHIAQLNAHIRISYLLQQTDYDFETDDAYAKIAAVLQPNKQVQSSRRKNFLKYAAIFIGVIAISFFTYQYFHSTEVPLKENPHFITLEMGSGEVQTIGTFTHKSITNKQGNVIGVKNENVLSYQNTHPTQKLVYNELWVPYGKRFRLILSDSTVVTLNSGSRIKYPVHFLAKHKREIYLTGEAFFDVATDSSRQFVVHTAQQQIAVYGTHFNVSAYKNDLATRTVLVEGSVGVTYNGSETRITPGQMAITRRDNKQMGIQVKHVNTQKYTAWINGKLVFINQSFASILRQLERHYNITINNRYQALDKQVFTASFDGEKVENILDLFSRSRPFHYTKNDHVITITKDEQP